MKMVVPPIDPNILVDKPPSEYLLEDFAGRAMQEMLHELLRRKYYTELTDEDIKLLVDTSHTIANTMLEVRKR